MSPLRVLYVDDDRINCLLFEETCRLADGITLQCAGSGREALALVRTWFPQLLIIDLHLPDTNGYHLLPALRHQLGQPDLPAYLCTADDAHTIARPALDAGYTGCWTKPVELGQVLDILRRTRESLPPTA